MNRSVQLGTMKIGAGRPFVFIAGPCVIEDEKTVLHIAQTLKAMTQKLKIPLIFKASYDKANRTSIKSFRGLGIDRGLEILGKVKSKLKVPVLSDVHQIEEIEKVAKVLDVIQIPAFLCRQTDLLVAAGRTKKVINIKKGQFMAPDDMRRVVEKARSVSGGGNDRVTVTERGASFGYHDLVVDMRSFAMMHDDGVPVIYDVTHSLQLPGAAGEESGGLRRFAEPLARAAVAAGADGLFLEVHPEPDRALSDRAVQLDPERAEALLRSLVALRKALLETGG